MHENDINNSAFEQDNTDELIDLFQSRAKQSRSSCESVADNQKSTKESKQITRAESFAMFVVLVVLVSVCNFGLHNSTIAGIKQCS